MRVLFSQIFSCEYDQDPQWCSEGLHSPIPLSRRCLRQTLPEQTLPEQGCAT